MAFKEQRKVDWVRIVLSYSIPFLSVVGIGFVLEHRVGVAEETLDTKVNIAVHEEVHKRDDDREFRVDVAIEKLTLHGIQTDTRIQKVNFDAQQAQQKTLNTIILKMSQLHGGAIPATPDAGSGGRGHSR